jgi:hypothetical protein
VRQALHIFKKDVRYLRWELGALLALMGMFVYTQSRNIELYRYGNIILLLSCLWAFVCARLIQAETIPGDRQFWVTRPYDWRSLLGAKLLFVVVFISISLLVADAAILGIQGFSVVGHIPGLLWSVMLITPSMLLAFCAFATLTRGLAHWMLSAIVVVGVGMGLGSIGIGSIGSRDSWGGFGWMLDLGNSAILFAAALVVLLAQYKRRRMGVAVVVIALGLIGARLSMPFLPFAVGLDLETRFFKPKVDPSPIQISVRQTAQRAIPHPEQYLSLGRQEAVALAIPIGVSGLGEGQDVITDEVRMVIETESGQKWSPQRKDYLEHVPDGYRLTPLVDRAVFEKAKGHAVRIHLSFYLTLVGNPVSTVVGPGSGSENISGVGRCRYHADDAFNSIVCLAPLRMPSNLLQVRFGGERWGQFVDLASYSPFPADSSISPVHGYYHAGSPTYAPATLTSLEPLAHFRRDVNLANVYLVDYQLSPRF